MSVVDIDLSEPEFLKWLAEDYATQEDRNRFGPMLQEEIELAKFRSQFEGDYDTWLARVFPRFTAAPLADFHREIWKWIWALERGVRPESLVGIVFRGGAKSSTAEMGAVCAGARETRKYVLYVSRTQDQADDHVANIGTLLESQEVADSYPTMSDRKLGKFGNSSGWRRQRLWTKSGFVVDAMGLDSAKRGAKLDDQRPDLIIFDDIDDSEDSPKTVRKLIRLITKKIIPAGSSDVAVMFIQNLIHANGIAAKLVTGEADMLRRRKLIGPIPALTDFASELTGYDERGNPLYKITSGTPTWDGFGTEAAEDLLNEIGETAFCEECQNDVDRVVGALWCREQITAMRVDTHPDLVRAIVGVDPSGGDGPDNDEQGIVVGGIGTDGLLYITKDISGSRSAYEWGATAVTAYLNAFADAIVGEQNYGGDLVKSNVTSSAERMEVTINYDDVTATRGKVRRFQPVGGLCGSPNKPETWAASRIKLCGSFPDLEEEMRTWTEDSGWSPNRLDAMCWIATYLMLQVQKKAPRAVFRG